MMGHVRFRCLPRSTQAAFFGPMLGAIGLVITSYLGPARAVTLNFNDAIFGQTTYSFDGDGDGIFDAVFSTSDPAGFNTLGPGPNQIYINEPGLEGTSLHNPDLRVDFPQKAIGSITFGFALNSSSTPGGSASFKLFDASNNLLSDVKVPGSRFSLPGGGTSAFPEGQVSTSFSGEASYGLFDFDTEFGRNIIDNFQGTFGSIERAPAPLPLLGFAVAFGYSRSLRKRIGTCKSNVVMDHNN